MVLRNRCSTGWRLRTAERRSGQMASIASMTKKPTPERMARISSTVRLVASARIATAISENDSSAPVIHRMTRMRLVVATAGGLGEVEFTGRDSLGRRRMSLRVRLIFRPRSVEGGKLEAGGVDGDDLGELVQRHLEAARVGDLRHQ